MDNSAPLGCMERAIDSAISSMVISGAAAPSAEIIAAARMRATDLLNAPAAARGGGDERGLKDLQDLTLSMGLPATRAIFQFMVEAANLRGVVRAEAEERIAEFSPLTEIGCMKVDFFNQSTGAPDIAYLVLDRCSRYHDLGSELDKLKVHISDKKWPDIIRSISTLVHVGRTVYGQAARKHLSLIQQIFDGAADDPGTKYLDLQVDPKNTTLFIEASWPSRVGIYIRLGADVQAELIES